MGLSNIFFTMSRSWLSQPTIPSKKFKLQLFLKQLPKIMPVISSKFQAQMISSIL